MRYSIICRTILFFLISCSQPPTVFSLQNLFNAGSGTLNICPTGNFVVNIQCGGNKSESSQLDEFDALVKETDFDF